MALCVLFLCAGSAPARAASALSVVSLLPQGEVARIVQIVVRFDRAMAPLGAGRVAPDQAPLRVEPLPAGEFRWLDPQTLAFIPAEPLAGSTSLALTVPEGVRALDGSSLPRAVTARVSTPAIAAVEVSPAAGSSLGPQPEVRLILNQPVKLDSLTAHASFLINGRKVPAKVTEGPEPVWLQETEHLARQYLFTLDQKLAPEKQVTLDLAPGILPARGTLPSQAAIRYDFLSYLPLGLSRWRMSPAVGGGYDPESGLVLEFNNPVAPREVWRHLTVEPAVPAPPQAEDEAPSTYIYFQMGFQPRTTYRLTLNKGLGDDYGTAFPQNQTWNLTMGDLPPVLSLVGEKGVLEAVARPLYPLLTRNLGRVRLALAFLPPDRMIPALAAEDARDWGRKIPAPQAGQPGVVVKELDLGDKPNQNVLTHLDLNALLGRPALGGMVLVDVRAQVPANQGKVRTEVRRAFLQVTDLGLSLKVGTAGGLVWATSLATGKPLTGVKLSLRDAKNREVWSGVSGPEGAAALPSLKELKPYWNPKESWKNPILYLVGEQAGQVAVLPRAWGEELDYAMGSSVFYRSPQLKELLVAHALTQLPLYQPGQKVNFLVYLRAQGPGGFFPPPVTERIVRVRDGYGRVVHEFKGAPTRFGSLAGSFTLTSGARLGTYFIELENGEDDLTAGEFRVASFRPPDFRVKLTAPASLLAGQAPGQAQVAAGYLFGAPVAGGRLSLATRQEPADFTPPELSGYAVGDIPLPGKEPVLTQTLGETEATLDAAGDATLPLPKAETLPGRPVRVTAEASVADPSERTVSGTASFLVHPSSLVLGLKAPVVAQAGKPAECEIAAARVTGGPAVPGAVTLTAAREYWETVRERGPGGFFRHVSQVKREEVWRTTLPGAAKLTAQFTPPRSGAYVLTAEAADADGRLTRAATYLWASGAGESAWQRYDDYRLELVAPKDTFKPGQTAKILVQNPFQEATALVSVERQGVRRATVLSLSGPAPLLEVPLREGDDPGVYVSVLLVRGRAAPPTPGGPDLGRPQVRLGYAELKVAKSGPGLALSVTTDQKEYKPGAEVEAKVKVTGPGGPKEAELTLLAVDERVLTAAGGEGEGYYPARTFSQLTPVAVTTADIRTQVLGQVLPGKKADLSAGGGGLGPALRRQFHPAVFWLAQAQAGPDGVLTARFKLPDSLTAYRVVAVAAGPDDDFVTSQTTITASLPLQLLNAMPRFAREGDQFAARVLVQNLGKIAGQALVTAQAANLRLTGPAEVRVDLAPGEMKPVAFPVTVPTVGSAALTVRAVLNGEEDAAQFKLEVQPATQLTTRAAAGALAAGDPPVVTPLMAPAEAAPGRGGLVVTLAPSLAAALDRPARYLVTYPWECLEQRLSKAAARALILTKGAALGLAPAPPGEKEALAALAAQVGDFQTQNGGLTYWPGQTEPDPFLSAYAILAARHLATAGVELPGEVRAKTVDYLKAYLKEGKPADRSPLYHYTAQALTVWVLALEGQDTRAPLEALLSNKKATLPPFGLACLLAAAGRLNQPTARDEIIKRLEGMAEVGAASLTFNWTNPAHLKVVMGSSLRGDAMALLALTLAQPGYPRLDALARGVAGRLGEEAYLSTQEAVFGLWGLATYLGRSGPTTDLAVKALWEGRVLAERRFTSPADPLLTAEAEGGLLTPGRRQDLTLEAAGQGRLFWTARLTFAPGAPPAEAENAGFAVARFLEANQPATPDQGATPAASPAANPAQVPSLGQDLTCVVSVTCPATRHHVLVQVPFPAGLEPDQAWSGPRQVSNEEGSQDPWSWREARTSQLVLYAPRLNPGVYTYRFKLRAVAPGQFLLPPAHAEEMYAPEVYGATPAGRFTVR
ncbi:MAG: hypothetical protein KQJ78_22490 [Deltaproteobacteria bacterium]|nr:hypothetical protein [Deltaproteobacteria bacterium]